MSGIAYYPPTVYFQKIILNNDFYAIRNNNQGVSLAYTNTHFYFQQVLPIQQLYQHILAEVLA